MQDSGDGPAPQGGAGDFFSVLLQNHITGVKTPRSDRPARPRPTASSTPILSFCSLDSRSPCPSLASVSVRETLCLRKAAANAQGDTSPRETSVGSVDSCAGGRPEGDARPSAGGERGERNSSQIFPFLRGRAASLEILKRHKLEASADLRNKSLNTDVLTKGQTDGGEQKEQRGEDERKREEGERLKQERRRDGKRVNLRRGGARRRICRGKSEGEVGGKLEARRHFHGGCRAHSATEGESVSSGGSNRGTSQEDLHDFRSREFSSRSLPCSIHRPLRRSVHRALLPEFTGRSGGQTVSRRSHRSVGGRSFSSHGETEVLTTGSTVRSVPSGRASFSAFENLRRSRVSRSSSASQASDCGVGDIPEKLFGRSPRRPAQAAFSRNSQLQASLRRRESPVSSRSAESSTRSAASEDWRSVSGRRRRKTRRPGKGLPVCSAASCASERLSGRTGRRGKAERWGVRTPGGSDWEQSTDSGGRLWGREAYSALPRKERLEKVWRQRAVPSNPALDLSDVFGPPKKAFSDDLASSGSPFAPGASLASTLFAASPPFEALFPAAQRDGKRLQEERTLKKPVESAACVVASPVSQSTDAGLQWLQEALRASPQLLAALLHSYANKELLNSPQLPPAVSPCPSAPSVSPPCPSAPCVSVSLAHEEKVGEELLGSSRLQHPSAFSPPSISSSSCPSASSAAVQGAQAGQISSSVVDNARGASLSEPLVSSLFPPFPALRERPLLSASSHPLPPSAESHRATPGVDKGDTGDRNEAEKRCVAMLARCRGEVKELRERVSHLRAGVENNLCDMRQWVAIAAREVGQVSAAHSHASTDGDALAKANEEFEKERAEFALRQTQQEERLSLLQLQVYGLEEQLALAETAREKQETLVKQANLVAKEQAEKHREKVRSLLLEVAALKEEKEEREREESRRNNSHAESLELLERDVAQTRKENTRLQAQLKKVTAELEEVRREQEATRVRLRESEEALRDSREREEEERKKKESLLVERTQGAREEEKLIEDVQRLHNTLSDKEAIFTEMKTEAERVRQELDKERQLREVREEEKGELERELAEAKTREEEGKEAMENLQQELSRLQRNIEQIQGQREQESRRHAAEKDRLRKQIDELEQERQAMHADATARLEEHLKAEEKLRAEAQSLRTQQRKKTNVEEELLTTKAELQHLKDELKDLLAEEVGKRAALTEENGKQQKDLESKQQLVRSLLQQKSTLEVKLQEAQRRELSLQRDVRRGEEELVTLKQRLSDLQLDCEEQRLATQRSDKEVERLRVHAGKLEAAEKVRQEELVQGQTALTESLEKQEAAAKTAAKWKALYVSQQSAVQQLREQLLTLQKSLLRRGDAEDALLVLHFDDETPETGLSVGDVETEHLHMETEFRRGMESDEKPELETGKGEKRGVREAAAKALELLLNAPVFQPSRGPRERSQTPAEGENEKAGAGADHREAFSKGVASQENREDSVSRPGSSAAARALERTVALEEAKSYRWSEDGFSSRLRQVCTRGDRSCKGEATSSRAENFAFRERREQNGDSSRERGAGTSDAGTPRFGAREKGETRKQREREDSRDEREERKPREAVSRIGTSTASLPEPRVDTGSRQTTASSDAAESLFRGEESREQRGRRKEEREDGAQQGDLRVHRDLLQLKKQKGELEREEARHPVDLLQLKHGVQTLEAEMRVAEESLSRATCTCEIAFHDILAQSARYHSSAETLQKIESAGKDVHLLPSLRQTLRAYLRETGAGRSEDRAEARKRRRGRAGRLDGRDEPDGDHEPFDEEEKLKVVQWMNHLVEETERSCYILEGAHAARDAAARERQQLQRKLEALSSELREKRSYLRCVEAKAKHISDSVLSTGEREQACLDALGQQRRQARPLVSSPPGASYLADLLRKSPMCSRGPNNWQREQNRDEDHQERDEAGTREACGRRRVSENDKEPEKTFADLNVCPSPRRRSGSPRLGERMQSRAGDTASRGEVSRGGARMSLKKERHAFDLEEDAKEAFVSPSVFSRLVSEHAAPRTRQPDNRDGETANKGSATDTADALDYATWSDRDVHAQTGGCSFWVEWSEAKGDLDESGLP
ncbi:putative liver stage antigen, related protein [Toxoplasma gondii MAS]|uniref:Putative liver stage antigen, related protein n=1 Tax=Toxoplasma gondii MAS TaxID=943118 RepID=A0A086QTC6_TOXGO|nr:putative liver stage antigen, related protein [Toxoplasma gondii MAS]